MKEQKKVGVVLSGGGIRGIAHIGFLKALEDMEIDIHYYAGTSSGSIIGALAAAGYTPDEMFTIAQKHQIFSLIRPKWPNLGLSSLDKIPEILSEYIPEDSFGSLEFPLAISISSLTTGQPKIVSSGSLYDTIQASCSIPILFKPVEIEGHFYVDGGLMNNLPAQAFRDEVELMIGVNLVPGAPVEKNEIKSIFQIAVRTFELAISNNALEGKNLCDIVIEPSRKDVNPILYSRNLQKIYDHGYESTKTMEDIIKEQVFGDADSMPS